MGLEKSGVAEDLTVGGSNHRVLQRRNQHGGLYVLAAPNAMSSTHSGPVSKHWFLKGSVEKSQREREEAFLRPTWAKVMP